ncbi:MAG: hypothetical protein LBD13_06300 [Spirochaetaceae bacterium]|nr:hypothetical protein [Spirochaetaceae bacterium]
MDRRRAAFGAGLLTTLLCGIFSAQAQQDYSVPLAVEVQTSPEEPALGSPWIITFLVDHPSPSEVSVHYPPLPQSLSLESIRTGARLERVQGTDFRRFTAIEFWLLPQKPGPIRLMPFEIAVLEKQAYVSPVISAYIQGTLTEPYWAWSVPKSLAVGEAGELSLRLFNWDPAKPPPKPELLERGVPVHTILEEKPLSESDIKQGIVLRLTVIPLNGAVFTLDALHIRHEGAVLTVPPLSIPLVPAHKNENKNEEKTPEEKSSVPLMEARETPPIPFPETLAAVFPPLRPGYENILRKIRGLWDEGDRAQALAELRQRERDHLAGPCFMLTRREAEQRLGFEVSPDEVWHPRSLALFFLLISLGGLAFLGFLSQPLVISKRKIPLFRGAVFAALLVSAGAAGRTLAGTRSQAVLREDAPVYRIPDEAGGISAYFKEGEPARILSTSEYWINIETLDGRIGWARKDTIILY